MKKEDGISLIVYILMIVIAVLVGLFVIGPNITNYVRVGGGRAGNMGMALLFVLIGIVFNVLFLEVAHLLGAKIGGYKIISFNILGLCIYRAGEKWKFKFSNFDGLTGETKIAPNKEKCSPKPFALTPLFFYVFEVVVCMVVFFICMNNAKVGTPKSDPNGVAATIMVTIVTIGGMLELYNIFPAHLDSTTDGYRLVILSKKENIDAYNELMRIECAYAENKEINDFKVFEAITDFTSQVNLYSVYKYLKVKDFVNAEILLDKIIASKDKITKETYCSALAQKMYLILLSQPYEEVKKYYEAHVTQIERRYIANDLSMQSIRAYLLISSMLDISEHEARYAISRVNKALKRTLTGRVEIEKELYQIALNKVDEVRPEWKIKEKKVD